MSNITEYFNTVFSSLVAIVGIGASILVLISMCFNTQKARGVLLMRIVNFLASIVACIYGIMLGPEGFSVAILNGVLIFVNLFYIYKHVKAKEEN